MTTIADQPTERPAYGAMFSTDEIIRANREAGFHYFSADTMRFFGSRVAPGTYGGRFFVTSEKSGFSDPTRTYSVREFLPDGSIETCGEFGEFSTLGAARTAAKNAAKQRRRYYFAGQHGKGGRKATYVVDAPDAWAAMERLHKNFRVFHIGHAADYMVGDNYPLLTA